MEYLSGAWSSLTRSPLKREISVMPPPDFSTPPLITAVLNHDINSTRDLLARGADANAKDDLDYMPLHYAAMAGSVDMVLLLLDHGADIGAKAGADKKHSGTSALTQAIASQHEDVSKLLMARGAVTGFEELSTFGMTNYIRWMPDHQFKHFQQSLIDASKTLDYLSRLWTSFTQSPLQLEPPPGFKIPPLIMAVTAHDIRAARDLCARGGVNVNDKDHVGYTSLHYAAMTGDIDMTSLLLTYGADVSIKAGRPQKSALAWAIVNKEEGTAKVLMAKGATTDRDELTGYEMASYIRWMPEGVFKNYRRSLLGPLGGFLMDD